MKRIISCFLLVAVLVSVFTLPAGAAGFPVDFPINSASAYVINADSGVVMYEQDIYTERSVASLTKLMTALLLIESVPDLAGTMFYAEPTLYDDLVNRQASTADIRPREEVDGLTLLYAMMLPSANEAASIAAWQISNGVMETFYAMMNARAQQLGCTHTNFSSANGLTDMAGGNYSCAYDIMLITKACMQYDIFRTVVASNSYDMPFTNMHTVAENASNPNAAYTIYTTNYMQRATGAGIYRSYIQGIKTGSTEDAGRCLVTSAVKDGMTYYCVTLGAPFDAVDEEGYALSFTDAANLYDWVFGNFSVANALDPDSPIAEVKVKYSTDTDTLMLYPADGMATIVPNVVSEDDVNPVELTFHIPESIGAPVKRGDPVGTVSVTVNESYIGDVQLLAAQDVSRNNVLFVLEKIQEVLTGTYVRVLLILTAIMVVLYLGLYYYLNSREKKRRAARRRVAQNKYRAQQGTHHPAAYPGEPNLHAEPQTIKKETMSGARTAQPKNARTPKKRNLHFGGKK